MRRGRKLREIQPKKKKGFNKGGSGWNLGDEEEEIVKRKILCASTEEEEGETERRNEVNRN